MKLLVVDDHPLMGDTIKYIIAKERPTVEYLGQALSGRQGIEMIKDNKPDILIADIMMPGMDGLTMIQQIKESWPELKIIIVTAFEDFTFVQRALRMGAVDYLLKPFRPENLLKTLDLVTEELENMPMRTAAYPTIISPLFHKLRNEIRAGNIEETGMIFQRIWQELTSSTHGELKVIRTRSLEIAAALLQQAEHSLIQESISLTYTSFVTRITKAQTVEEIESCLKEFLDSCSRLYNRSNEEKENEQIFRVKELIDAHIKENITLESIAQKVYLNPCYLSRLFKKQTQVNFIDYLIERRLNKAKELLLTTDETVEYIAIETGYVQANSFRRLFKKKTGLSPNEYRRLHTQRNSEPLAGT